MTKKELLERILERIAPDRPAAHGILLLLKEGLLSDEKISSFVEVFRNAAKESQTDELKQKFSQSADLLEKMQELEEELRQEDEKELVEMEKMLLYL